MKRVWSEPRQREGEPGERDDGSGPEDEHPLDQVGALARHFGPHLGQALLQPGLEPRKVEIGDLPNLRAVHSSGFLPPGKQVIRRLFAEDIMEPLDQPCGYRHAANLKLCSACPASNFTSARSDCRGGSRRPLRGPPSRPPGAVARPRPAWPPRCAARWPRESPPPGGAAPATVPGRPARSTCPE